MPLVAGIVSLSRVMVRFGPLDEVILDKLETVVKPQEQVLLKLVQLLGWQLQEANTIHSLSKQTEHYGPGEAMIMVNLVMEQAQQEKVQ